MRSCKYIIILIVLLINDLSAQDITGLWKGTLYNDTTRQFYRYELAISEEKGKLTGYSHTWFILDDKQFYGVKKVKTNRLGEKIIVEDAGLIANNYPVPPAKNVRQLNSLDLEVRDSLLFLTGTFITNQTKGYHSLTGKINIQRRNDFWQSALVPHLQELSLARNLSFVIEEERILVKKESDKKTEEKIKAGHEANKKAEEILIAKIEADRIEKERNDAAFADVVVNKKEIKTGKTIVKKEDVEIKYPVAVSRKIITVKDDVARSESVVEKNNSIPRKKEAIFTKAVTTPQNKPDTNMPVAIEEKLVLHAAKKGANENSKPVSNDISNAAFNLHNRNTELQQTVYFKSDSLQLSLFDNGEVDGDTVSVLLNGKILFAKERLSTNAVRKTIFIDEAMDSLQLVMYAENLGTIAPNTGLLVVKDGKDIYEIRFSGDLSKNAAIIFRRKK